PAISGPWTYCPPTTTTTALLYTTNSASSAPRWGISNRPSHYQQSIQHEEARGNTYGAGHTRYNIAQLLNQAGRPGDALHYARAALNNYRDVGPGATTDAQQAQTLIYDLEQDIEQGTPDK
ncbi:MAG: hypothetical protein LC749_06815, partial [Actinobacteria bacterium]|nr:hypothetical protein [Actinomycetota bacterium]